MLETIVLLAAMATQAAPPCAAAEHRQMDFWIGDWVLEYDRPDGSVGSATNAITDEYGGCAIVERFSMPNGFRGSSYSAYDPEKGKWRQMWVDNQGGSFVLEGGPVQGQPHRFELRTQPVPGHPVRRMTWQSMSSDQLVWRWQSLQEGGAWRDDWVIRYRRGTPPTN